ncbi:hypothetical protein Leryth_023522 [Lithospermum erythrorhizon]|nr:hypothetical protein Leryth_023522 [Lithospermum erythrorhizon]
MEGGNKLYRFMVDKFQSLEASHAKLKEQVNALLDEKSGVKNSRNDCWSLVSGVFSSGSSSRKVLEQLGHAVFVSKAQTGEIMFWNRSAERLYGYKEDEVIGQKVEELLVDEEHRASAELILEGLHSGNSWSGQFPLKKRSRKVFMALVTKSPLYENGELVGVITVSSDAAIFNNGSGNVRIYQDPADCHSSMKGINFCKIQWPHQPQIASSVSNLASKVLFRKRGFRTSNSYTNDSDKVIGYTDQNVRFERPPRSPAAGHGFTAHIERTKTEITHEKDESNLEFPRPSKIAAKVLSKFNNGGLGNSSLDARENVLQSGGGDDISVDKEISDQPYLSNASFARSCSSTNDAERDHSNATDDAPCASRKNHSHENYDIQSSGIENRVCSECAEVSSSRDQLQTSCLSDNVNSINSDAQPLKPLESEEELLEQCPEPQGTQQQTNSDNSSESSQGNSSRKGENESNLIFDCEIHWEDLHMHEEIGQGFYGIVYRGMWKGSDVAVKVYNASQCTEETSSDYKTEIEIMRRLRHPNVLLFMGAVYSQEKLAVVTEYLPRGSLFKALHKSNQPLDVKRRLGMALDVARGMNYLHHRNPPIVHRDLKSSNLLVGKSWTVKVGDFGLSRWKYGTFLSARSGRGTPQWMAPEVLRSEPSTEKSDVYSFGVVLWELMTESVPWSDLNPLQVVGVVGFMDRRLDIPENLDPQVASIIHDCWNRPESRPSFEGIIQRMKGLVQTAKKSKGP